MSIRQKGLRYLSSPMNNRGVGVSVVYYEHHNQRESGEKLKSPSAVGVVNVFVFERIVQYPKKLEPQRNCI